MNERKKTTNRNEKRTESKREKEIVRKPDKWNERIYKRGKKNRKIKKDQTKKRKKGIGKSKKIKEKERMCRPKKPIIIGAYTRNENTEGGSVMVMWTGYMG